jgi:hypothetical protein
MRVNREYLKKLSFIKFLREDEDLDYTTHFEDPETLVWIHGELQRDNMWAWFSAHVVVTFGGLTSHQYLGGCSYESEAAFKTCETYEDLVGQGLDEIVAQLESLALEHGLWVHDPIPCIRCAVGA